MIETCREMNRLGLNQGASGNLSVRLGPDACLITPSGTPYDALTEDDIATLSWTGSWRGSRRPSTEWRFHRDILRERSDVDVVLHAHSRHATAIACLGLDIPAFHYMVAVAGGDSVRCAPYARFGSQALSDNALEALRGRRACLLANHGLIALGRTPESALALLHEIESLAAMYVIARQLGAPVVLDAGEMAEVLKLFAAYGTPAFPDDELTRA